MQTYRQTLRGKNVKREKDRQRQTEIKPDIQTYIERNRRAATE